MATGDFQFNFTNLNPLNTSGWSTSALATRIKAMQDAAATKAAEDAAKASVYGHMNKANKGKGKKGGAGMGALGLLSGGAGTLFDGDAGPGEKALSLLTGGGSNLFKIGGVDVFGGSDPRTPAEKLAHQTKMLAKQETKTTKTASDLANAQHDIDALNEAIGKATDPKVIEHLNKDLEKAQKQFGKVQQKHDANTSHVDEIKKKVTGLDPNAGAKVGPTKENYYNEIVDKTLASRTGASGWHGTGVTTGGTDGTDVKLDPITGEPVVKTPPPVDDKGRVISDPLYTGDVKNDAKKAAGVEGSWDFRSETPVFIPRTQQDASLANPNWTPPGTAALGLPQNHVGKFLKQQAKILGVKPGQFKKQVKSGWGSAPVIT